MNVDKNYFFFWEENISQIKLLTPQIKRYVIFKTLTLIWSTIWFMSKYQLSQSSAKWALLINSVSENHSIILTLKFWSNLQLFLTTMVVICLQKMAITTDNNSIIYHYIFRKKKTILGVETGRHIFDYLTKWTRMVITI